MVSDVVLLKELPQAIKKSAHPASCVRTAIMKDEYLATLKQAGFRNLRIIEEKHHSFEDVVGDPNAKILVADPKKKTQGLKSISELEEEARKTVKEILGSTASISVSAMKPTGAV